MYQVRNQHKRMAKSLLLLPLIALACARAQAPAPPTISPSLEAEYYRADGIVARMKQTYDAATLDLQKAIVEIQKTCGDKYQPTVAEKHLVCVAAPPPPAAASAAAPKKDEPPAKAK
jgi:hypothetical protein